MYGIIGHKIPETWFSVFAKIGSFSNKIVQNRFDSFRILGEDGYYYISRVYERKTLIGGMVVIDGRSKDNYKPFTYKPYLGYDNISEFSFGCIVKLNFGVYQ